MAIQDLLVPRDPQELRDPWARQVDRDVLVHLEPQVCLVYPATRAVAEKTEYPDPAARMAHPDHRVSAESQEYPACLEKRDPKGLLVLLVVAAHLADEAAMDYLVLRVKQEYLVQTVTLELPEAQAHAATTEHQELKALRENQVFLES